MPYGGQTLGSGGIVSEADEVIRAFGMAPTPANLCAMAEEIERRTHIYAGGPVRGCQVVRELYGRASAARQGQRIR